MKFQIAQPLRKITAINVATMLWNCVDRRRIMVCLEKYHALPLNGISMSRKLSRIEDEVKAKILQLEVPQSQKEDIANLVKPLGMEIMKWCKFHCLDGYLDIDIPKTFYWTSRGTIDLQKTAKVLVRDKNLYISARYKLACIYCLEEEILGLWLEMSDGCRYSFYSNEEQYPLVMQHQLVIFWTLFKVVEVESITGVMIGLDLDERQETYQFPFILAASSGNIVATKYFWEKLSHEGKGESFSIMLQNVASKISSGEKNRSDFPPEYYPEVFLFLFSQLDAELQIEVYQEFEIYAYAVLSCLMQWPFNSLLMETASIILNYTSDFYYCNFLVAIADRVYEGHGYYDYSALFITRKPHNS